MSNDIKAGDLVMVVRPTICCGNTTNVGLMFIVIFGKPKPYMQCRRCGAVSLSSDSTYIKHPNGRFFEISRLKKIPPLSDLEDASTQRQDMLPNEQEEVV